jgi:hypothetical protein
MQINHHHQKEHTKMRKIYIALQSSQIFILLYCVRKLLPHLGGKWSYSFLHALSTGTVAAHGDLFASPSLVLKLVKNYGNCLLKGLKCALKNHYSKGSTVPLKYIV